MLIYPTDLSSKQVVEVPNWSIKNRVVQLPIWSIKNKVVQLPNWSIKKIELFTCLTDLSGERKLDRPIFHVRWIRLASILYQYRISMEINVIPIIHISNLVQRGVNVIKIKDVHYRKTN